MSGSGNTSGLMSQRELAKKLNMRHSYINKLVNQKKIPVHEGKKVKYDEVVSILKALRDPSRDPQRAHAKKLRARRMEGAASPGSIVMGIDDIDLGDDNTGASELGRRLQKAKIIVESQRGIILRLQAEKEKGELVAVEDIKAVNERIATSIRSKLLAVPTKIAPQLEGMTAGEMKLKLEDEINEVLSELNRMDYK